MNVAPARPGRTAALAVGLPVLGACAGAATAAAGFVVHPAAIPLAAGLASLAAVSLARMEIGVAAAFVLLPLGYVVGPAAVPWVPGTLWIGVLLALALARWLLDGSRVAPGTRLPTVLTAFVAVLLVGVIAAGRLDPGLPVLRSVLTGIALAFVIATEIRTLRQVRVVLAGVSIAAIAVGGHAAYQYLAGGQTDSGFFTESGELARRVSAGFPQPNQLGGFLVLLIPFSIAGAALHRRAAPLHMLAAALGAYGVYVSFSRGALVALAAVPLVMLRGRAVLLLAPLLLVAAVLAAPDLLQERFATLTERGSEIATRADFWRVAAAVWAEDPLVGAGLGTFPDAYASARVPGKGFLPATIFEPPPHAHNLALHTLAEQGLIGLAALLAVFVAAVRVALRLRRSAAGWIRLASLAWLASLTALLLHNLVDVTLLEATATVFFASLGLLAALVKASAAAADTDRGDPEMAS